ncbi:hypothetical protein Tco_0061608, partial [Tanacetum coccineum]
QSKAKPNKPSSLRTSSGGSPRLQETIGDTIAQTRSENVSKLSNDPLLARDNTFRSGEDSLKLNDLMELCTNLQTRVLDSETTKTNQANEIASLKRRFKKLEKKNKSRTHKLKRLYKERRITLTGDKVLAEHVVAAKDVNLSVDEVTLAQALAALKSTTITTTTTTTTTTTHANVQDKGKGKMVEPKKPMKKKELIRPDKEIASKLQAEFDEEAKIEDDHELAQRLQAQEQEELSDAEKATC